MPTPPDHNVDHVKFVLDLRRGSIMDAAVLGAMEEVPRDKFVMPASFVPLLPSRAQEL